MKRWTTEFGLMLAATTLVTPIARAQDPHPVVAVNPDSAATLSNAQRPMVTRAQLQATLNDIEQQLGSTGYSEALRSAKRVEADVIRARLADGDFHVGDIISMTVQGDAGFNGDYQINTNDAITLHGGTEISLHGLLRSEVQDFLTRKLSALVKDPVIHVSLSIRVTLLGAVNKPGFFYVHADWLLNEVLMNAGGGPTGDIKMDHSKIMRGDKLVVDGAEFAEAIRLGKTMDELNIQNGDEITVASKTRGVFLEVLGAATAVGSLTYLAIRIL